MSNDNMIVFPRQIKAVKVTPDLIGVSLIKGERTVNTFTREGLPPGAVYVGNTFDPTSMSVYFFFYHDSFPPVNEDEAPDIVDVTLYHEIESSPVDIVPERTSSDDIETVYLLKIRGEPAATVRVNKFIGETFLSFIPPDLPISVARWITIYVNGHHWEGIDPPPTLPAGRGSDGN